MTATSAGGAVADFRLDDEERLLREAMRDMLAAHWSVADARKLASEPPTSGVVWPVLAEWVGVVENGTVATCIAAEEAGAALAPGELLAAWALASLLVALEHPLAERALAGGLGGGVAYAPDGGRLVLEVAAAGPVATVDEAVGLHGADSLVPLPSADLTRSFARFAPTGPGEEIRAAGAARARWADMVALLAAADALGACRSLLAMSADHARDRRQFGRPIGTFQAVRHHLVDLAVALERASASTYLAAMLVDADDPGAGRAVHASRASTAEAVARFSRGAVQLHGAIGYTWDHDVHVFVRRAYVSDRLFGSGAWHRSQLVGSVATTAVGR
jgi:hypothetical protein